MSPVARSALSLLLATSLALAPMRAAFAGGDDGGAVTVWTKDGGMFRGEIVERVPNDHITIKLATGETKRIEWKDVERDSLGTPTLPAPEAATTADAADVSVTPTTPIGKGRVTLRGSGVRLERLARTAEGYGTKVSGYDIICIAPCDAVVTPGGGYRVSGEGLRSSKHFEIGQGAHSIDAELGSNLRTGGALVFTALGGSAMFLGGVFAAVGTRTATDYGSGTGKTTTHEDTTWRDTGLVLLGIGAVSLVVGLVLFANNANSVKLDDREVATRKPSSDFAWTPTGFVF